MKWPDRTGWRLAYALGPLALTTCHRCQAEHERGEQLEPQDALRTRRDT
jgi:hypothetical protein